MDTRLLCLAIALLAPPGFAQTTKFTPADGGPDQQFGLSLASSGDIAILGAPFDDDNGGESGSAYLFSISSGLQIAKLLPDDGAASERFGTRVALRGGVAIVSAPGFDLAGSAYLFSVPDGQQLAKLTPSDGAAWDRFGHFVAISETLALVGAPGDDDNGTDSGSAYLFSVPGGQQLAKLLPGDGATLDAFGLAGALDDGVALISAVGDDDNGPSTGSVYVYSMPGGQELSKFAPQDLVNSDQFGTAIALRGDVALVSSRQNFELGFNAGAAYLFSVSTGQQLAKLLPGDQETGDLFGTSVALSEGYALVGAAYDDDNGLEAGSAYLFSVSSGQQLAKVLPADGQELDFFGRAVTMNGNRALVGTPTDDDNGHNSGSAYVWDLGSIPGGSNVYCVGAACPCGNDDPGQTAGCVNSTGSGASIAVTAGQPVITADDLVLTATGLPPSVSALLFMGDQPVSLPLGDGLRCVGGNIYRLLAQSTGPQGVLSLGPGIVQDTCANFPAGACVSAGDQRYFQVWYRDPSGPCQNQFNVSNAIAATFAP